MTCQYADALGFPREGIHAARIPGLDVALWDVVGTVAIGALLGWLYTRATNGKQVPWNTRLTAIAVSIVALFIVAELLHWLFCVPTQVMTSLGLVTPPTSAFNGTIL